MVTGKRGAISLAVVAKQVTEPMTEEGNLRTLEMDAGH
jgi:hypothetical protein